LGGTQVQAGMHLLNISKSISQVNVEMILKTIVKVRKGFWKVFTWLVY